MKFYEKHPKISTAITFAFFILMVACNFPIYNLTREWSPTLTFAIVFTGLSLYISLGAAEAIMLSRCGIHHVFSLNLLLVLLGMGARYLLEYGEVSNTYNFTLPNMLLHICVAVVLSTLSWLWTKTERCKKVKEES